MRRMNSQQHQLGVGIGWRSELAMFIERHGDLDFVEVIAEEFSAADRLPMPLAMLRSCGVAIVPHGISLSLGGAEPPHPERLKSLARLARLLDAPLVSEHLAFVRAGGMESGHLLPLCRTRQTLEVVAANIRQAANALPVPLAIENIASLVEWPNNDMDEASFLAEVLDRTDTGLLLDVSNLYGNALNHGWEPEQFLDRVPLERISYVHVAGGVERNGLYHDSHAHPVMPAVLELLEELCSRVTPPGVLLELDDQFPADDQITAELAAIADAVSRGTARRERAHAI
jgi:uncharacterized protein (UPF0276 family)